MTANGRTCQGWASNTPHGQPYAAMTAAERTALGLASNQCRNPNSSQSSIWCYTTDPTTKWELCVAKALELKEKTSVITETGVNNAVTKNFNFPFTVSCSTANSCNSCHTIVNFVPSRGSADRTAAGGDFKTFDNTLTLEDDFASNSDCTSWPADQCKLTTK